MLSPDVVTGQEFLVKNLTDRFHQKYNSRKILALLQLVHFVRVIKDDSEILEASFTKEKFEEHLEKLEPLVVYNVGLDHFPKLSRRAPNPVWSKKIQIELFKPESFTFVFLVASLSIISVTVMVALVSEPGDLHWDPILSAVCSFLVFQLSMIFFIHCS